MHKESTVKTQLMQFIKKNNGYIKYTLGETPYKCDQCPSAFTHIYTLKFHKLSHAGRFLEFKSVF